MATLQDNEFLGNVIVETVYARTEEGKLQHKETGVDLRFSENVETGDFFTEENAPNLKGLKYCTDMLCNGLIVNIHYGHQNGMWDSAAHLRMIIDRLQEGFILANANIKIDTDGK
jgi:hypothetical protein